MSREPWPSLLARWSAEWIASRDPESDRPLDEEVVRTTWLGFAAAGQNQIAVAETRLGRALPPSLREFLLVTNGWRQAGDFIDSLAGTTELAWLRDTTDSHWIEAYSGFADDGEPDHDGDLLRRSLRISLEGDSAVLLLDPDDVDVDGEWAGYWLASWSGSGPERHNSFYDLMFSLYRGFHALNQPPGDTRDGWDARVEQARLAALDGEIEGPMAILEEADAFGRSRATLLRFQMYAMLNNWHTVGLSHLERTLKDLPATDPLFAAEILPLLMVEDRLSYKDERFTLNRLKKFGPAPVQQLIIDYETRFANPDFRLTFGNREFDVAVHAIRDRVLADPAFQVHPPTLPSGTFVWVSRGGPFPRVPIGQPLPEPLMGEMEQALSRQAYEQAEPVRQARIEAAWPELLAAMSQWRPLSDDHIAPIVLFADPLLARMITPERGRELLALPRPTQR